MTLPEHWMVWTIVLPLAGALLALVGGPRAAAFFGVATTLPSAAAAIALVATVVELGPLRYAVGGWRAPLGIDLFADGLAAAMILMTAVVGSGVSVYGVGYFSKGNSIGHGRADGEDRRWLFWPLWLMLWGALNALYLAADLFNIYVTLELLGLAAVGLVALAGGASVAAALRYLLLALAGSMLYVLGVELLYASNLTLDLHQLRERIQPDASTWLAAALMTAALLVKTALFPLHFWLPPAHGDAASPVSAALSALVVKAGFYLILRLWLELFAHASAVHVLTLLGVLGAGAVLWGSVQALRQQRLKMMIAYSTVAQLGYLFIVFPIAGVSGALAGTLLLAFSHACAKAALFMCAGSVMTAYGHDRIDDLDGFGARLPLTAMAFALAGISLIGLPPSGGFVGKWMLVTATLAVGAWWWAAVIVAGSLLAAAYLFHALSRAFLEPKGHTIARAPRTMELASVALALLSIGLAAGGTPLARLLSIGVDR